MRKAPMVHDATVVQFKNPVEEKVFIWGVYRHFPSWSIESSFTEVIVVTLASVWRTCWRKHLQVYFCLCAILADTPLIKCQIQYVHTTKVPVWLCGFTFDVEKSWASTQWETHIFLFLKHHLYSLHLIFATAFLICYVAIDWICIKGRALAESILCQNLS